MKTFAGLIIATAAMSALAGCTAEVTTEDQALLAEETQLACANPEGTNAMIAALAAAMGTELGRWEVLTDFYKYRGYNNQEMLGLSSAGLAQCAANGSACNNIKNLLAFQDSRTDQQIVFGNQKLSAWSFASRLSTGFGNMQTFKQNKQFPYVAHKLKLVGKKPGGCDTLYTYNVTAPNGAALTAANINGLVNSLKFGEANGPNPYIAFQAGVGQVTVDPSGNVTEEDTSSQGSTWACQKYNPGMNITGQACSCPAKINKNGGNGKIGVPAPSAPLMYKCE